MYTERVKTPEEPFFFFFFRALRFVKVEASQGPCQCKTVLALCVRACVKSRSAAVMEGGGGSQAGQLAADSGGELRRRKKSVPAEPFSFSNNGPLVRLSCLGLEFFIARGRKKAAKQVQLACG